jgi:uncharacterized protein (DUF885 family)
VVPEQFRSPLFALASSLVDDLADASPSFAIEIGAIPKSDDLDDFSPSGYERTMDIYDRYLVKLDEPVNAPVDEIDRIAAIVMRERLSSNRLLLASGEVARTFSVLDSPAGQIRQVFEIMSTETSQDREAIVRRLLRVPASLATWRETLDDLAAKKLLPAARQVSGVAEQTASFASGDVRGLAERLIDVHGEIPGLLDAAAVAAASFGDLSVALHEVYLPQSTAGDFVGAERYQPWSSYFTGATLDLAELYEWGWADLCRINERMWQIAAELAPRANSLPEVAELLDTDAGRTIHGTDEILRRLKEFTARTTEELNGAHFDIDRRIQFCDVRLAPEGSAAAPYYLPPSEDLSRPGTTWLPTMGNTSFHWWRLVSTWYHESVPGHHLQCAVAMLQRENQSRFHRVAAWTSGYGEGWALYAERLMEDLGGFSDPGDEMGFLSAQALRAARIVVDLGLHLQLEAPGDLGVLANLGDCSGTKWTPTMAVALLEERALLDPTFAQSEVDRYLGLAGQAISYKVGERYWLAARESARARHAGKFDLKAWHSFALNLGPLGLDDFAHEMDRF